MTCPFDNDPVGEGAALLHRELNIRQEIVIRPRRDVLAFPDNYLFERHHQNLLGQNKNKRQINICMNRLKKDIYRPITRHLCLGGVDSKDELSPGIPSATGLPIFWLRASSSASVRGGICLLSVGWVEVCVSLNMLNYFTEYDKDEKTFMCVKTALCWG